MKNQIRLILGFVLVSYVNQATAQTAADHGTWEENNNVHHKIAKHAVNEFENTEMAVNAGVLVFSDLPDVKKNIWAIITDADGMSITQKRVSAAHPSMELRGLRKGNLYFVTLVYKDKSQKAFVLHR